MTKIGKRLAVPAGIILLILVLLVYIPLSAAVSNAWVSVSGVSTNNLRGVWYLDDHNVFAVGDGGSITYYNGTAWNVLSSGTVQNLNCVWGTGSSGVFAAGDSGVILHYSGLSWSPMSSGTTNDINSIWGTAGDNIYAAGNSGTLLHYDGTNWSIVVVPVASNLTGIWGRAANDIFAVGQAGNILHYNGTVWSAVSSGTTNDLYGVWGTSGLVDNNVYAAGKSGTVLKYNGTAWSALSSGTTVNLNGVWCTGGTDVFIVGDAGVVLHYNGSEFVAMSRDTIRTLNAVWGVSEHDIFAVGNSGAILRYYPPVITAISPATADAGVTREITLTGENFNGASEVRLGSGIAVKSFVVVNPQNITASITVVAEAEAGLRDVTVSTPFGSGSLTGGFIVGEALPSISLISPNRARQSETLNVTLTGINLGATTELQFGADIAVNDLNIISDNQISANITITAGAAVGTRDVSISTAGGSFVLPGGFSVEPAVPEITDLSPDEGNQDTMITVTLNGTNFNSVSAVSFGAGIVINSIDEISPEQLAVNIRIAAGAATGYRDVTVTTAGGSFTLPDSFLVKQMLPSITSVSPNSGSQGASLSIVITGSNFTGATLVRLGSGIAVNNFNVDSAGRITANISIVTGAETGVRSVTVTTPGGSYTLESAFTVKQGVPIIATVSPGQGGQGATLTVIISGSNLGEATSVNFGSGITVQSFNNLSPTQISANVVISENAVMGMRDVSVTTPGGSTTKSNSFSIEKKSLGVLLIVFIWLGVVLVIGLFVLIITLVRRRKPIMKE